MNEKVKYIIAVVKRYFSPVHILPAAYCAIALSLLWTPMDSLATQMGMGTGGGGCLWGESVSSFTRQIGQALVYGIDINKRVANMTFYGFFYLPMLFLICWCLLSVLFRGIEITNDGASFLQRLTAAAFPALIVTVFSRLDNSFFSNLSPIAYVSVVAVLFYLRFGAGQLPLKQFKWAFFSALSLEFFGIRLLYSVCETLAQNYLHYTVASTLVYLFLLILLCIVGLRFSKSPFCDSLCAASTPLYAAPVLVSLFLEVCNILNQYGIFIGNKVQISLLIAVGCALIGVIWYVLIGRKMPQKAMSNVHKWQYLFLVLGMAMLLYQPAMQIVAGSELFESSNNGSDIYAFLTAGELPMVENLNVHMILEELGSILYGALNQDALGAIWFCYPFLPVTIYLLLYGFFVILTDWETGVFMELFFPGATLFWLLPYWTMGLLPVIAAIFVCYRKNRRAVIIFILSCVILCLYHADMGLSCAVAALLVLTVWLWCKRERKLLNTLWLTGICAGALCLGLFVILCMIRGISPLARILELISILQSNLNWTYREVTSKFDFRFFYCYLLVPAAVTICTTLVLLRRRQNQIPDTLCLLVGMLALSQLLEFYRGIIRHNLAEGFTCFSTGYGILCILITLWILARHRTIQLPLYLSGIMLCQILTGTELFQDNTLLQSSINQQLQTSSYQTYEEKIDRVVIPENLVQVYQPLKVFFDATMTPEQTYFDFSCDTLIYTLTNRDKPVYINQSPCQLNAEFDHLIFIREIEQADCPYALCQVGSAGWDGIDMDINHYLVAEYLNQNYRPLCFVSNYCLWVDRTEYAERRAAIQKLVDCGDVMVTFVEETDPTMIKSYELGQTAWLWGTYDQAEPKQTLQNLSEATETARSGIRITQGDKTGTFIFDLRDNQFASAGTNQRVAVWCSSDNDQDDLIWYPLKYSDETFCVTISVADHLGQTGDYQFHVYYDDMEGTPQIYTTATKTVGPDGMLVNENAGRIFDLRPDMLDRSNGNYLEIVASTTAVGRASAELVDTSGNVLCTMLFDLHEGQNRYLLRISGNYMWYTDLVAQLRLTADENLEGLNVNVLSGDVDYGSMNFLQRKVLEGEPCMAAAAAVEY